MSIASRLLGIRAAAPARTDNTRAPKGGASSVWYSTPGQPQIPLWDGLTALQNGYQASIYVMQPVRIIATALGSLPFRVGADPSKPGDYDSNAPLARLLGPPPHGPNPVTSPRNLWIWSIVQRLICGRMAWETVRIPGSDTPGAIWPLVAPFMHPVPSGPGTARWFDGYEYQLPAGTIKYQAPEVFYSWRPSQADWRQPESALQAASMPTSLQIALDRYMWALAKNGLAAKKLVITPEFAEDDERRAWEEQFASEFTGYDNGGRVMHGYYEDDPNETTTGNRTPPIQVVDLASTPADAQVLELLKTVKDDMLRTWRVPMSWMGDSSQRTYENASQEARNFWQGPVMEAAAEIADDVNMYLAPRFGDGKVGWWDFSSVEALKGTSIFGPIDPAAAVKAGLIVADDWRNDVGLPPQNPADVVTPEDLPAIDDSPGGTSMTNFSRRSASATFTPGRVDAAAVRDLLEHAYPGSVLGWVDDATWKYDPAVPLDEIKMARRPGGRDIAKVEAIATAVRAGEAMDPVVLVDTGEGKLEIADGYHRTLAFDRAGKRTIPAIVGSGVGKHGPWERDMHDAKLNRSDDGEVLPCGHRAGTCTGPGPCDTAPFSASTTDNWVARAGGLPAYIRAVAHALARSGHDESSAIATAVATVKRWAAGEGNVSAATRARAAKALAEWEAKKAAAHAGGSRGAEIGHPFYGNQWVHGVSSLLDAAKGVDAPDASVRAYHGESVTARGADAVDRAVRAIRDTGHVRLVGSPGTARDVATRARSHLANAGVTTAEHAVTIFGQQQVRVFDPTRRISTEHGHPYRDAVTESSSVGALLPVAPMPKVVTRRHMFIPSRANRRKCALTGCGKPVTAAVHGLTGRRHAGPGHASVPTGHRTRQRRQTLDQVHRQADSLEPSATQALAAMFAQQRKATLDRLNGRRGQQMLRAATPPPPEPPDTSGQAPLVDAAQIYDFAHWAAKARTVIAPVYGAVRAMTADRFAGQLGEHTAVGSLKAVQQVLDDRLDRLAQSITQTTLDQVAQVLRDGVVHGQTLQQMTDALTAVFDDAERSRAPMIARTEAIGSLNQAADVYAGNLPAGIIAGREWLSAHDERVRPTHREADGQIRALGDPYLVGGTPMLFPGDPAAPPDEVINCRCTQAFLTPAEYAKHTQPASAAA